MSSATVESLRLLIHKSRPHFLIEVHDGISTRIAERSGFQGLWASSFGCTAALGLPDDDSMSPLELGNYLLPIVRSSRIPVLVDGNSGFASLKDTRAFVKLLVQLGAAGVCFEDKQFPKRNTFYAPSHPLRAKDVYCHLIAEARRACLAGELAILARTEALVVGEEIDRVVSRCEAYCEAGAEAVFVGFAKEDVTPLRYFIEAWKGRAPLLLNPTAYLRSLSSLLGMPGVSIVVWANHNIRASVKAMSSMCSDLVKTDIADPGFATRIDGGLSSMADIFDLIGYGAR